MGVKKENRGGNGNKRVKWNGMLFNSLTDLAHFNNRTKGSMCYALKWSTHYKGHEIIYL